jgi:hypothetical protein
MSEALNDTLVAGENVQPVTTDTDADNAVKSESNATPKAPNVESRDGKLFVDGVRVYTRDDVNRIGANAKKEVESRILGELEVDSFDQVKTVVKQLRNVSDDEPNLNVASLRDAVKKKEQTVEELRAELTRVKTDMVLKDHLVNLNTAMPASWNQEQRSAVVDLMKARNMLHLEGETFAIRNGDTFFTDVSGERPDYAAAVMSIGKTLGLPITKQGVAIFDAPDGVVDDVKTVKVLDQKRLSSDPAYRNAYVQVRNREKNLSHSEVTDAMVRKQMDSVSRASLGAKMLSNTGTPSASKTNSRR